MDRHQEHSIYTGYNVPRSLWYKPDYSSKRWRHSSNDRQQNQHLKLFCWRQVENTSWMVSKFYSDNLLHSLIQHSKQRLYCKNHTKTFDTPEAELRFFILKMSKPGWKWPPRSPVPPEHTAALYCKCYSYTISCKRFASHFQSHFNHLILIIL